MIRYADLAQAAFDNDSMADEGRSIDDILSGLDFRPDDVMRAANQRALRMVLALRGVDTQQRIKQQAYDQVFSVEDLSDDELLSMQRYAMVWVDALAVSAKAVRQHG